MACEREHAAALTDWTTSRSGDWAELVHPKQECRGALVDRRVAGLTEKNATTKTGVEWGADDDDEADDGE